MFALGPWVVSALYEPVMRWWPETVGEYDTEQDAVPVIVPAVKVHVPTEKVPVLLVVKLTDPVGVVGLYRVSVIVATHEAVTST